MRTATWMGRKLEDLTKEELIEAVLILGEQIETQRKAHQGILEIFNLYREFKNK